MSVAIVQSCATATATVTCDDTGGMLDSLPFWLDLLGVLIVIAAIVSVVVLRVLGRRARTGVSVAEPLDDSGPTDR